MTVDPIVAQLAATRRDKGLSLRRLAGQFGGSFMAISEHETGRHSPTLVTLRRWAAALGYDLALVPADSPQSVGEVGADRLREGFAPTPCTQCRGDRAIGELGSLHPCPGCCCVICGEVTDTPPECGDCCLREDDRARRREDV